MFTFATRFDTLFVREVLSEAIFWFNSNNKHYVFGFS